MAWKDVCRRGSPAGGRVREDDISSGSDASAHDAGGPSPGILKFVNDVVMATPPAPVPAKPSDFPASPRFDTYPGRGAADVHFEGRAADIYFNYNNKGERVWGDWLFDWCVANCAMYKIQGVIFGERRWFSEAHGGLVTQQAAHDHFDHIHVELNCDGAASS